MVWASFGLLLVLEQPPTAPQPVVNGTDAATCQFPSVVRLGNGCSGSLVAPNIVLTAAHCLDPSVAGPVNVIYFGENEAAPARSVGVERCERHPEYELIDQEPVTQALNDVGLCVLTEDIDDVPPIPILFGCEVDQLVVDAPITIVGFGATSGGNDDPIVGGGTKRFGSQTVEMINADVNDLLMVGPESAVCFGDSGGPALLELDDGTWRIAGVASSIHPMSFGSCGYGSVHDLVHTQVPWLEEESGVDLTPCFDGDGTWAPTEECDAFPTSPADAGNLWDEGCGPHAVSDLGATCGDPFGTVDEESTGGGSEGSSTGTPSDTSTGGGSTTQQETTSGPPPPPDETGDPTSGGTSGDVTPSNDDAGCGCRTTSSTGAFWMLALLAAARRRTPGDIIAN